MSDDSFTRGFYDIPSDEKLRGMGYVELAALLASTEKGSAKYMVVEREKARRDALELAPPLSEKVRAEKPRDVAKQGPSNWSDKPMGKIAIGVIVGTLVFLVVSGIQKHITS